MGLITVICVGEGLFDRVGSGSPINVPVRDVEFDLFLRIDRPRVGREHVGSVKTDQDTQANGEKNVGAPCERLEP